MLDFICPNCGTFAFESSACTSCDGRGDDTALVS